MRCAGSPTGRRISGISTSPGCPAGDHFTTTDNFDFTGGGERCGDNNGPYPVQTGDARLSRGERTVDRWFNTDVFRRPSGPGDVGNNAATM